MHRHEGVAQVITSITLNNFRSIYREHIQLGPFNVLVGANGSGKSNLVKALEFISSIPARGFYSAFQAHGGFESMVPKAIPKCDLQKTKIGLDYVATIPPFDREYFPSRHEIAAHHGLQISYGRGMPRVAQERLDFDQVFAIARALEGFKKKEKVSLSEVDRESSFSLVRGLRGGVQLQTRPAVNKANVELYLRWLGLEFAVGKVSSAKEFREFLKDFVKRLDSAVDEKPEVGPVSFMDPSEPTAVDFSQHFRFFREIVMSTRRYDLQLNELRVEQRSTDSVTLDPQGKNLPSALRRLKQRGESDSTWLRLTDTLSAISPHIQTVEQKALRSRKEFVEFVENPQGRGVESWESSDGTLRALGMLIALETHPETGTLLIEEPEQNLHPWAIRTLIEHIRHVVEERNLQVVLTTHSQQVLEAATPSEVLIASRTAEAGTKIKRLQAMFPDQEIEMGQIGNLWVKGLLGGVPEYV